MRFSLIVATVDRTAELERLLESLHHQTVKDFEVIVVDQNADDRVRQIVQRHQGALNLIYLRCARGVSRGRNTGWAAARGQIMAFPDDDCWYPPDVLEKVWNILQTHPNWDAISGRALDAEGNLSANRFDHVPGRVTWLRAIRRGCVNCLFLRHSVIEPLGRFDESLGGGTRWIGTEDLDWLCRMVHAGLRMQFLPRLYVNHPQIIDGFGEAARIKEFRYCMGMGRVLRKNHYPLVFVVIMAMAEIKELCLAALTGKFRHVRFHAGSLVGLIRGWIGV